MSDHRQSGEAMMAATLVDPQLAEVPASVMSALVITHDLQPEANRALVVNLAQAFEGFPITLAISEPISEEILAASGIGPKSTLRFVSYTSSTLADANWSLTTAEFRNAFELLKLHPASIVMLLGAEADSLSVDALRGMYEEAASTKCDLITARYELPARSGLVNSGILYPLSRALFGASPRFPLAVDVCLSARLVERLTSVLGSNQRDPSNSFVWPVTEAVAAGLRVGQYNVGSRSLPQPASLDLNDLINQVVGSCFADIEAKAAVWQRMRIAPTSAPPRPTQPANPQVDGELAHLVEGFRLASTNLRDVWTLVLPPQTLLGLKRLAAASPESFVMPNALWARIVYDFVLAFRLRTLNRNHLLGSFTPLYLAWLASHLSLTAKGVDAEEHIQQLAAAFESEKSYLVARWRWPDRFNP